MSECPYCSGARLAYLVAAALRGPDIQSAGAQDWKIFVVSPLRWFAAESIGEEPNQWCQGRVESPSLLLPIILAQAEWSIYWGKYTVHAAQQFAITPGAEHVVSHARAAYGVLGSKSSQAQEYLGALIQVRLLP